MWDKTASEIQTDVELDGTAVSGTSKYVASWAGGGFDPTKGTNYIALHFKGTFGDDATGVTCVAECVPSQGQPTPAFNDDDAVMQIKSTTTGIKVTVSKEGEEDLVKTFSLADLELETEAVTEGDE